MSHGRKISVIGLGYVGLPVAVAFGQTEQVIGFDINQSRIDELKRGEDSTNEADIDRFFAINFKGSYFVTQAAVPHMKQRGGGVIVNVGTTLVEHAIAGFPASAGVASKAALHSLTNQLAAELGPDNIRVSTIATGIIDTPLHAKQGIEDANALAGLHLLNRIGDPEDMADAIVMLARNHFITGTVLRVDGGHAAGHAYG